MYLGHDSIPRPNGLGWHVVMDMVDRFLDQGHHVYYDNFFSSVQLAQDLLKRNTYMASTIRMKRKAWPSDLSAAAARKMKKGDVELRQDGNMVATLWKDKRVVSVFSTNSEAGMTKKERRAPGGKRDVLVPTPVANYNEGMGGVDLADQLSSYYTVGRPSIRWWRYLCWWLFQVSMVNSYLLYRASMPVVNGKPQAMRHIDFRWSVLRSLVQGNVARHRRAAPQAVSMKGISASNPLEHVNERLPGNKKNCVLCQQKNVRAPSGRGKKSVYGCLVCRVHLCPNTCHQEYHQCLNQSVTGQ